MRAVTWSILQACWWLHLTLQKAVNFTRLRRTLKYLFEVEHDCLSARNDWLRRLAFQHVEKSEDMCVPCVLSSRKHERRTYGHFNCWHSKAERLMTTPVGDLPNARITVPSSFVVMHPSPSCDTLQIQHVQGSWIAHAYPKTMRLDNKILVFESWQKAGQMKQHALPQTYLQTPWYGTHVKITAHTPCGMVYKTKYQGWECIIITVTESLRHDRMIAPHLDDPDICNHWT